VQLLFLALEAALYPTLLAAVVILLAGPRPRPLLAAYLAGGLTISIALGLVIVFALEGAVNSESSWSEQSSSGRASKCGGPSGMWPRPGPRTE